MLYMLMICMKVFTSESFGKLYVIKQSQIPLKNGYYTSILWNSIQQLKQMRQLHMTT